MYLNDGVFKIKFVWKIYLEIKKKNSLNLVKNVFVM